MKPELITTAAASQAEAKKTLQTLIDRVDECDSFVVILQKKQGGLLWDAPATQRVETTVFLLECLKHDLMVAVKHV